MLQNHTNSKLSKYKHNYLNQNSNKIKTNFEWQQIEIQISIHQNVTPEREEKIENAKCRLFNKINTMNLNSA